MPSKNGLKTVAFLGASNTEHGHFIYALRSYLKGRDENVAVYNCGIGGMRADRVTKEQLDYEVGLINADYCVINFGINDLGIWLYDSFLNVTDFVIDERNERNENFFRGIKNIVKMLKEMNVAPVLMSPFPSNELLVEKPDIPTLGDNKEKAQLINPWFYKRKTFENINQGLKVLNDWLREYSQQEGIKFLDVFELLRKFSLKNEGMFNPDGIHYTKIGGQFIVRAMLEAYGNKRGKKEFVNDVENDKIYLAERNDRSVAFMEFNHFNYKEYKSYSAEDKRRHLEKLIASPKSEQWFKRFCQNYLNFYSDPLEPRKEVERLTKKYLQTN